MFPEYTNMSRADRIARLSIGSSLIVLGTVYHEVIDVFMLNALVTLFGLVNIVSAWMKICPAYLLTGFSSIKNFDSIDTEAGAETVVGGQREKDLTTLRRKLLLSIAFPMFSLLVIFGGVLYVISHDREMIGKTKNADVAASAVGSYMAGSQSGNTLASAAQDSENAIKRIDSLVDYGTKDLDLFYYHDTAGNQIQTPFDRGLENEQLFAAVSSQWAKIHRGKSEQRGMMHIGDESYIWSTQATELKDRWVTSVLTSTENHTLGRYLLVPKFLIIVLVVLLTSYWLSAYIIKKFIDNVESGAKALKFQSLHDSLTGLPNRQSLHNIISQQLKTLNSDAESISLLMIDVIDFRDVNDTLGFALGDKLLIEIGSSLSEIDPERNDIVKMGGDVFCVVCKTDQDRFNVSRLSNTIHDVLERSHELNGIPVAVQVRIGVASYPVDSDSIEELVRCSDIALANAKSWRLKDCFFQHEQDTHSIRKLTLLARLRAAIDQDELTLVYQPKVDISSQQIVGVEVLVRWFDEEYGAVSPAEFVNWAQKSGLIDRLTRWVLTTAELQCREWRDRGYVIPLAVNLSPTNLYDSELIPLISRLIHKGSFGNGMLELEITENAVMEDPEKALNTMKQLKKMGVSFAIDDFGTGLSSFAYLRRFPVSNLKIDRAFIADIDEWDKGAVLLKSMINLGHGLDCVVTAEGVEDQATIERLKDYGCNYVQGFHVCKPLPADSFIQWVDKGSWQSIRTAA